MVSGWTVLLVGLRRIYSIDNVGTFSGKITYTPSLDEVWAGCWSGTPEEFYTKCDVVVSENETDYNLDVAKFFVKSLHEKYIKQLEENKNE